MDILVNPDPEPSLAEKKKMVEPLLGDEVLVVGKVIHVNNNYYVVRFINDPLNNESVAIVPKTQVVKLAGQFDQPVILKQMTDTPNILKNVKIEKMATAVIMRELDIFKQPTDTIWLHNLATKDLVLDEEEMGPLNA